MFPTAIWPSLLRKKRSQWSGFLRQARGALGALQGRAAEAEAAYRDALAVWRRLDMKPDLLTAQLEMLRLLDDALPDRDVLEHAGVGAGGLGPGGPGGAAGGEQEPQQRQDSARKRGRRAGLGQKTVARIVTTIKAARRIQM